MFKLRQLVQLPFRRFLTIPTNTVLEYLNERSLLRVSGPETSNFLQGLITNDIEHLSSPPSSMYTMILNSAGRVLYDTIIYRNSNEDTYFLECDSRVLENLQKHLKMYRVRRKIDISNLTEEYKVYALFNSNTDPVKDVFEKFNGQLQLFRDPRLSNLGLRIVARVDVDVHEHLGSVIELNNNPDKKTYRWLRYSLGVGEGITDLPSGDCFPLENNCDYLHGVSFHKGCYVGQELTARVYHTGVVRKRLMPIQFTKAPTKTPDEKIVQDNVNLGKLRGIENNAGLALVRIAKALAFKEIQFGDGIGFAVKPSWWPTEAPKDIISASKSQ